MKRLRDVTPMDFAVNLRGLCVLMTSEKTSHGNHVLAELCEGSYHMTSGGLFVIGDGGKKKDLYSVRALDFSTAINFLNESYGERLGITYKSIEFSNDEIFSRHILSGGSIGIYPYREKIPHERIIVHIHDSGDFWDIDTVRKAMDEDSPEERAFDTGKKVSENFDIKQIAKIGVYTVREKTKPMFSMFDNGIETGIDAICRDYVLQGLRSFNFKGVLEKMNRAIHSGKNDVVEKIKD